MMTMAAAAAVMKTPGLLGFDTTAKKPTTPNGSPVGGGERGETLIESDDASRRRETRLQEALQRIREDGARRRETQLQEALRLIREENDQASQSRARRHSAQRKRAAICGYYGPLPDMNPKMNHDIYQ